MPINMNKVILVGRLAADPERKGSGDGFVTCRMATSKTWKDKDGEKREQTEWHSITLYAKPAADFAMKYLKKGDIVMVEGALQTRSTGEGSDKKYYTSVVVNPYEGNISAQSMGDKSERSPPDERKPSGGSEDRGRSRAPSYDEDDEIPF